jgi:hypothetical protein
LGLLIVDSGEDSSCISVYSVDIGLDGTGRERRGLDGWSSDGSTSASTGAFDEYQNQDKTFPGRVPLVLHGIDTSASSTSVWLLFLNINGSFPEIFRN